MKWGKLKNRMDTYVQAMNVFNPCQEIKPELKLCCFLSCM